MNEPPTKPVKFVQRSLYLPFDYIAGDYKAQFARALKDKKILGSKCSKTGKVFVPPLTASPESFAPCDELVEVSDKGVITTFCIVNIPVSGRDIELPYVAASITLDGADLSLFSLVRGCKPDEVRMGMRVEAVWKPDGERSGDLTDIDYFRPTGEPDAPEEFYIHRL